MTSEVSDNVQNEEIRLLHAIDEFSETVGIERHLVIRRLAASIERSLAAERLRGRIDIRSMRR